MNRVAAVSALAAGTAFGFVAWFSASASLPAISPGTAVYTANSSGNNVSVLAQATLARIRADIAADESPLAVVVSADGSRVYVGNESDGTGSITVIDGTTNSFVQNVTVSDAQPLGDLAVSRDGSKVYATIPNQGHVVVMDAATLVVGDPLPVPSISSNSPRPDAIDVSADGSSIFVLNVADARVEKMSTADGSSQGSADVSPGAKELKVSADGATLIVVGDFPARFFATDDLAPVATASTVDLGQQLDVAVAGGNAYVLNQFVFNPTLKGFQVKGVLPNSGPSIDVYDAATGEYLESHLLGPTRTVLGIAVLSDASKAFVTYIAAENLGSTLEVNLATGALGVEGATGSFPRRVAVNEIGATTPVKSYFLPRRVVLTVATPSSEKDSIFGSGLFDDGGLAGINYASQPVTLRIGAYTRSFTLTPNKSGTRFTFQDATLRFVIRPNFRKASLGIFSFKISKTPLLALIDATEPVAFHFTAPGLPDALGTVKFTNNRYRRGTRRGDIVSPHIFPARVIAKLGALNKDTLVLRGGFATGGAAPQALGTVRVAFGKQFARTIAGDLFVKSPTRDAFTYKSATGGEKLTITVDFSKDSVSIDATGTELGPLAEANTDFVFDAGDGQGAYRNTIRLSTNSKGVRRNY